MTAKRKQDDTDSPNPKEERRVPDESGMGDVENPRDPDGEESDDEEENDPKELPPLGY